MNIQIKNRYDGTIIFTSEESVTLGEAVKAALEAKINLRSADLRSADLRSADLRSADLRYVDLSYANRSSADLRYANLSFADLHKIKNADFQIKCRQIVPQEGDFIGFKKLRDGVICKLKILGGARRVGGVFGRKCRAEFALVLEGEGTSTRNPSFVYKVGEIVTARPAYEDSQTECAPGIHFYLTREEAQEH